MSGGNRGDRGAAALIFLFVSCLQLATFGGHFYTGDGIEMYKTTESLVLRGDLAVLPGVTGRLWGYEGADGRRYSPYAVGLSVAQAPLFAVAHAGASFLPLDGTARQRIEQAAAMSANVFVTAATCVILFLLARALGFSRRASSACALLYGTATMAWVYSKHDFAEPLAALGLIGAAHFCARAAATARPRDLLLAGAFNGVSFFTKYQMVLYTPLLMAYLYYEARRRRKPGLALASRIGWFLAPGLLFGLANLWVNHARFGSWLSTGYANQGEIVAGWSFIPVGLFGLLLSPGKGLLWFSPLVLAAPLAWREFRRRSPGASLLGAAVVVTTLLMFAPLWWWHGDWAWGPRYLLVALPFLVLPLAALLDAPARLASSVAGRIRVRHVVAALVVAALIVNGLGLAVNFFHYIQALRDLDRVHDDWNFIPNLSPIRFHAHVVRSWLLRAVGMAAADFRYRYWCDGVIEERVIPLAAIGRGGREPDFFFFGPRDTPLEQAVLAAAGLALLGGAAGCAWRLRRVLVETA